MKRFLSILLAICMLSSVLVFSASAAESPKVTVDLTTGAVTVTVTGKAGSDATIKIVKDDTVYYLDSAYLDEAGQYVFKTKLPLDQEFLAAVNIAGERTPFPISTKTQAPELPFVDVNKGAYYYDAVVWAYGKDITTGISDTRFAPKAPCTRKEIVTFLWRANGRPEPTATNNPFVDVKGGYAEKAILWAYSEGITNGVDATHFRPNGVCTREQAMTFLWRANKSPKPASHEHPFTDLTQCHYSEEAIVWAFQEGITTGVTSTTFAPRSNCQRGQIVTFLYRDMVK